MAQPPQSATNPTVLRRRLGGELRRIREAARMTGAQAAHRLGWSASKISRAETGLTGVSPVDVRTMLEVYGVSLEDQNPLVELTIQARKRGWWHQFSDVLPEWFTMYLGLEAEASSIQTYESELVPGILQTADYARAVLSAHPTPETPDEVERQVASRMARQGRLREEPTVRLHSILNEAVLLRPVGGWNVMREQLDMLLALSQLDNVTIQVLPFAAGVHPSILGSFVVLEFPDAEDRRVVHTDYLTGAVYLEKLREVGRYRLAFDQTSKLALTAAESFDVIEEALGKL